jgi:hypothetical protein
VDRRWDVERDWQDIRTFELCAFSLIRSVSFRGRWVCPSFTADMALFPPLLTRNHLTTGQLS